MKQYFLALIILSIFSTTFLNAQTVQTVKAQQLLDRISKGGDTVYVVNFWATWCQPCVKELPIFNSTNIPKNNTPSKILLVSLDFKNQVNKRLIPFLQNNKVQEEVLFLDEANPNTWVNQIDPNWSGAIPATKFYGNQKVLFHEGEISLDQFIQMVKEVSP